MLSTAADDRLARALACFDLPSRPSAVAAVSGGSDSMALLVAAERFLASAGGMKLVAVTVDHGLREASAREAAQVAGFAAARAIPHRTLRWDGAKPATGIAAAAREARYGLLADAARSAGTDIVLTGHTADDQAETVAMRARRGPGRGLAGMAEATLHDGSIWIVRPFLGLRRAELRAWLERQGIGWTDDPSNTDPASERAQIRRDLSEDDIAAWLRLGKDAGRRRTALGTDAATLIERHARRYGETLSIAPEFLGERLEAAAYAFRFLLAAAGGGEHLPDADRALELMNTLHEGAAAGTLAGTVVRRGRRGLTLTREARHRRPPRPFPRFLPGFDLAPAAALAKLLDAPAPPAPPYAVAPSLTPFG